MRWLSKCHYWVISDSPIETAWATVSTALMLCNLGVVLMLVPYSADKVVVAQQLQPHPPDISLKLLFVVTIAVVP